MRVWTSTEFEGYWPVGTAAVVVAETPEAACELLKRELSARGLDQQITASQFVEIETTRPVAVVLRDGNY